MIEETSWAWQTPDPHGFIGVRIPAVDSAWQAYAPSIPEYVDLMTPRGAWVLYAPRTVWTIPAAEPRQRIFVVTLRADGLDDYELPVSTIMIRLRDVKGSYIRVTVPNPTAYTTEIIARAGGRMHIEAGYLSSGNRNLEEIIYGNISSIYYNRGSNDTLMLGGDRYITHSNSKAVTLDGVSRIQKTENGRVLVRCAFDLFLKPGDTATAGTETFTVDLVSCVVTGMDAYMDVEGA